MLALVGATLTDVRVLVAACTVRAAEPLTPLNEAVTFVVPADVAVANPDELTDATDPEATVHVAVEVTLAVVPLL
jgi:hypothetical protein